MITLKKTIIRQMNKNQTDIMNKDIEQNNRYVYR